MTDRPVTLETVIGHSPFHGGVKEARTLREWLASDNRTAQFRARQLALQLIEQQAAEIARLHRKPAP
jgi:uncharacterized protein (DUF1800 family)